MTETMNKAQRILALLAEGKTTIEIAAIIGCRDAYVRVVRQRAASPDGLTPSDRAWREKNPDKVRAMANESIKRRYHSDPEYRARQREHGRAYYERVKNDPAYIEARNSAARQRYRAKKTEIEARRKERRAERRAIVAAMVEVAHGKA